MAKKNANNKRDAVFHEEFREDLCWWIEQDRKIALKICKLIEEIIRSPFEGSGKPEALKYALAGCWSRRITGEHRIVYLVQKDRVDFLQARYHY